MEPFLGSSQDGREITDPANKWRVGPEKAVNPYSGTKNVAAKSVQRLEPGLDRRQMIRNFPVLRNWFILGALGSGSLCLAEGPGGGGFIEL